MNPILAATDVGSEWLNTTGVLSPAVAVDIGSSANRVGLLFVTSRTERVDQWTSMSVGTDAAEYLGIRRTVGVHTVEVWKVALSPGNTGTVNITGVANSLGNGNSWASVTLLVWDESNQTTPFTDFVEDAVSDADGGAVLPLTLTRSTGKQPLAYYFLAHTAGGTITGTPTNVTLQAGATITSAPWGGAIVAGYAAPGTTPLATDVTFNDGAAQSDGLSIGYQLNPVGAEEEDLLVQDEYQIHVPVQAA